MKAAPKETHIVKALPHTSPPLSCRFDPEAKAVFASAEDRSVVCWDLATGAKRTVAEQNGWIQAIGFVDKGATLVAGSTDGNLHWWDAKAAKPKAIRHVHAHDGWTRTLAVSRDGAIIATGGNDSKIKLWSTDGKPIRTLAGHATRVYCVAFAVDGMLWSGDLHGHVKRWDIANGKEVGGWHAKELHKFEGSQYVDYGGIRSIAFSPDGKKIACGGLYKASNPLGAVMEPLVQVFDIASGKLLKQLVAPGLNGTVWRIAWHSEGFVAAGVGGNFYGFLVFWNPEQEKDLSRLQMTGLVRDIDLHPDGLRIATAHYDRHVRISSMSKDPAKKT